MMIKCPVCGAHVPEETAVEFPTKQGAERYCSLRCAIATETASERAAGVTPAVPTLPPPPHQIVVAVDGSGPSLRAVELAASIAKGGTRLGLDIGEMEEALRKDAIVQLERCGQICEGAGVEYVARVEMKSPPRAIIDASEKADLVVMGSRGLGAFTGAVLGSLSHRVIAETRKPVLVVH
jgi:nucleotide-binding universal stress UspA family protein